MIERDVAAGRPIRLAQHLPPEGASPGRMENPAPPLNESLLLVPQDASCLLHYDELESGNAISNCNSRRNGRRLPKSKGSWELGSVQTVGSRALPLLEGLERTSQPSVRKARVKLPLAPERCHLHRPRAHPAEQRAEVLYS